MTSSECLGWTDPAKPWPFYAARLEPPAELLSDFFSVLDMPE